MQVAARVLVMVAFVAACGGGAVGSPALPGPPARRDAAAELARQIPRGAQACAVSRPARLSARQRALVLPLMRSHRFGWTPETPIVATASAEQEDDLGRRASIVLVRVAGDIERVRVWLDRTAPMHNGPVHDGDHDDDFGDARGLRGFTTEILDAHTMRVTRGEWGRAEVGAEADCRALAELHRESLEVSSRRLNPLVPSAFFRYPHRVDHVVTVRGNRVVVERRAFVTDPNLAEGALDGASPSVLPDRYDDYWDGNVHVTENQYVWEDLVLAREDRDRLRRAQSEEMAQYRVRRAADIDVSNLALVEHQRRLWGDEITTASGEARTAAIGELRLLLERATDAHPDRDELRRALFRVVLDLTGEPAVAAELAASALASSPSDEESWRGFLREAFAHLDDGRLATALVEHEQVERAHAVQAARDITQLIDRGIAFSFAESAVLAAVELGPALDRRRGSRATRFSIATDGLLEAVVAALEAQPGTSGPRAVYLLARGHRRPWANVAWDPDLSPLVVLHPSPAEASSGSSEAVRSEAVRSEDGRALLVGAATTGLHPRLGRVSRAIADTFTPGPIEVGIFLVPFDPRAGGAARVVLRGELGTDALAVTHVNGTGAGLPWERIARYLARPLATLEDRTFPAPEIRFDVESSADADRIAGVAALDPTVTCRVRELVVTCRASPDAPSSVRQLVRDVAAAFFGAP